MCVSLDGENQIILQNHNWKVKLCQFPIQVGFVIDYKWTTTGSLTDASWHLLTKSFLEIYGVKKM